MSSKKKKPFTHSNLAPSLYGYNKQVSMDITKTFNFVDIGVSTTKKSPCSAKLKNSTTNMSDNNSDFCFINNYYGINQSKKLKKKKRKKKKKKYAINNNNTQNCSSPNKLFYNKNYNYDHSSVNNVVNNNYNIAFLTDNENDEKVVLNNKKDTNKTNIKSNNNNSNNVNNTNNNNTSGLNLFNSLNINVPILPILRNYYTEPTKHAHEINSSHMGFNGKLFNLKIRTDIDTCSVNSNNNNTYHKNGKVTTPIFGVNKNVPPPPTDTPVYYCSQSSYF